MTTIKDGPYSKLFTPVPFTGNTSFAGLARKTVSKQLRESLKHAPHGKCVSWGIPFAINKAVFVKNKPVSIKLKPFKSKWLVFLHTSDIRPDKKDRHGFISPMQGTGKLNEHAANYILHYADGSRKSISIMRRHQIGMIQRPWGENCVQAVAHKKPHPLPAHHEQVFPDWGASQCRAHQPDMDIWINWLYAWQNPCSGKKIIGLELEPISGAIILSGISAGNTSENPLKWQSRQKALLTLPKGEKFDPALDKQGLLKQVRLDMGQIISAQPQPIYPQAEWAKTYNNKVPKISERNVLVEYTAHADACFHLPGDKKVCAKMLKNTGVIKPVAPAEQNIQLKVVLKGTKTKVACKLHAHGVACEYLPPVDRHRIPNNAWFEDYAPEFVHQGSHYCTYIDGETLIKLPLGTVYIEIAKGFEIKPIRKKIKVTPATTEIIIEIEKLLPWREKGWVTSDTHVHFLSPQTALLEGAAEGVNVVNLLASQWGELMTNAGDFDGKTTHGSIENGSDGEYLVRVGTENRQHVMGHISLIGYEGNMISPMTTGGPRESAIGDPIEVLLTEWARQCKNQNGVVVIPHFPNPRMENAAAIVSGNVDGIEMTSWGDHFSGIDPYSLSDWYRYLNCGYQVAAVAGTDKMSANTAVGTIRTYAHIPKNTRFSYDVWKKSICKGNTFVTYGPLMEMTVDGKLPGSAINMSGNGGTVDIEWNMASVTIPMTRTELMVNGEIQVSKAVRKYADKGHFSVKLDRSSWIALLARAQYPGKPEMIAAHSSAVMINIEGSQFFAKADAITILEQIEGSLAYLDTIGTRAQDKAYKRMRMVLTSAHRSLHNRMHTDGHYHKHSPVDDHKEHH